MSGGSGHSSYSVHQEIRRFVEEQKIFWYYHLCEGADDVQLGSARAYTSFKLGHDAGLAILEAWGNLGDNDITFREMRISFFYISPPTYLTDD